MANWAGVEPASGALTGRCSAIELPVHLAEGVGLKPTRPSGRRLHDRSGAAIPATFHGGAVGGIRTPMLLIRIQALIHFSYDSVIPREGVEPSLGRGGGGEDRI